MNFHAIILWVKKYVFPCKEDENEIGNVCEASKVNLNSPDYDWQCVDKGGIMISSKTSWVENISVKKIFLISHSWAFWAYFKVEGERMKIKK